MGPFRRLRTVGRPVRLAPRGGLAVLALLSAGALLPGAGAVAATTSQTTTRTTTTTTGTTPLPALTAEQRRILWSTIDVCNAADDPPHTIGIRGSMPGVGGAKDTLYMRFRLQQQEEGTGRAWVDLKGADSGFMEVGSAKTSRQYGWLFVLQPVTGAAALTLRGVVTFQWRSGATVLQTLSRPTTVGHRALAGADPVGFSAATCPLS